MSPNMCHIESHVRELDFLRAEVLRLKQLAVELAEARPAVWATESTGEPDQRPFRAQLEYEVRLTHPNGRQLHGRAIIDQELWHSHNGDAVFDLIAADVHRQMNGKRRDLDV